MISARLAVVGTAFFMCGGSLALACGGGDDTSGAVSTSDAAADGATGSSDGGATPVDSSATGDANDAGACKLFTPDPTLAAQRASCAFEAGAPVSASIESPVAARAAITHVIVLTHENRSVDHLYGTLGHGIDGFSAAYSNPAPDGGTAFPTHMTTACPADIPHSPAAITAEWDNGKMDGFDITDGPGSLGYYEPNDHPFYTWLLQTFATSDRYFCSMMGETGHNRRFLYGASATQTANNIFTEMDAAKVTWGNYFAGAQPIYNTYTFPAGSPHLHPYADFLPALDAGNLPSVTYLDTPSDEHPPGSILDGESVVYQVLQHAFASPLWPHLAIVFNYDEGGGFFDHVNPPPACLPSGAADDAIYNREGFRVPLVMISPYSRKGYVSHVDHSHTSTLRLIELLYDLPAITNRDANSDALLDLFDFECPDFVTPPVLPATPTKGCTL